MAAASCCLQLICKLLRVWAQREAQWQQANEKAETGGHASRPDRSQALENESPQRLLGTRGPGKPGSRAARHVPVSRWHRPEMADWVGSGAGGAAEADEEGLQREVLSPPLCACRCWDEQLGEVPALQ